MGLAVKHEGLLNSDQLRAAEWFQHHQSGLLWGSCGVGKTVSVLTGISRLIDRFDIGRTLVVGPRLIAERVWSAEVAAWAHLSHLKVVRIVGTEAQRLKALATPADIHTISRDNVVWLEEQYIRIVGTSSAGSVQRAQHAKWPFDTVILDESQSFKSQSSKRFKSMRRLRRLFSRIYLLSGSPMPNGWGDLWAQFYLIDGGARLGATEEAFHQRWFVKDMRDGVVSYELRTGAEREIERLIADACCVMRDAQPAAPRNFIRVKLDLYEQRSYNTMVRQKILELNGAEINAINAGVLWGKLTQLANGAVYDGERLVHELHTKKIEALLELLESLDGKVLIGYSFLHDVERIRLALARAGVSHVGVIRTSESLEAWKRGEITRGLIHPKSAGHGLNDLKDADHVVWFGLTPDLESFEQLNGRVLGGHRRQGRAVGLHMIVCDNTVDEELMAMLDMKDGTQTQAQIRVAKRLVEGIRDPANTPEARVARPGSRPRGRPPRQAPAVAAGVSRLD